MRILSLGLVLFLMAGCLYTPKTLSDLRSKKPDTVKVYDLNYQTLAECWQNNAKPTYLDWKRSSFLNIYNEKSYAVITTGFSLMEIKSLNESRSEVISYHGGIHKNNHEDWFKVFDACAEEF